jgi:phosphatidylglycerophosphate synthase
VSRIADLRARAQRKTGNLYDTWFTRRVSIYITAGLYVLGISANTVSAINCVAGIAACALIGLGDGPLLILGVGLVHLFAVLDSVDGELARLRQTFTIRGLFLEDLAAYTMINGMFLAVGGYLLRTQHVVWPLLGAVAVVAFGRNAMQVARRAILKSIATRRPVVAPPAGSRSSSAMRTFVEKSLLHYTNVWLVMTTAILVEELGGLHRTRIVLYVSSAYAILVGLKELAVIATYARGDSLERQLLEVYRDAGTLPTEPRSGDDLAGD